MQRLYRKVPRIFYWCKYCIQGKYGILGPFKTEEKAESEAQDKLRGAAQYKIVPLDTCNKASASGKLKAVVLDETHDITKAMQRMRIQPPTDDMLRENRQVIHWT